ncbi:hypothetical protein [Chitinophaga sp. CF418]|uniref:hypothetical protein n=1 Tax=Chitinophaga sp. CF418 TaxID=1855287 RepID=UPI000914A509|nr:hypothetical protein [Chitinophaga sp. CF418]SHN25028.1 hypothetical protein SAMN05216311_107304 [Chitinophaga sp. CF418]
MKFITSPEGISTLQTQIDNSSTTTQTINHVCQNIDLVLEQHDGTPLYQATSSISLLPGFDSGSDTLIAEINASATGETVSIKPNNYLSDLVDERHIPTYQMMKHFHKYELVCGARR